MLTTEQIEQRPKLQKNTRKTTGFIWVHPTSQKYITPDSEVDGCGIRVESIDKYYEAPADITGVIQTTFNTFIETDKATYALYETLEELEELIENAAMGLTVVIPTDKLQIIE